MGLGYSLLLLLLFVEASCEYCFFVVMGFLVSGKEGIFFLGFMVAWIWFCFLFLWWLLRWLLMASEELSDK